MNSAPAFIATVAVLDLAGDMISNQQAVMVACYEMIITSFMIKEQYRTLGIAVSPYRIALIG